MSTTDKTDLGITGRGADSFVSSVSGHAGETVCGGGVTVETKGVLAGVARTVGPSSR